MEYAICVILGYLIGSFNPAYLIGRLNGTDIRHSGSGNAGASNALMHFGKKIGILCAVCDIAKACLVIVLCKSLFPDLTSSVALSGCACILGHIFPFYMSFKGGKGLACYGGLILMFDWRVFLIFLASELVIVLITDYICFVPLTACIAFPITYAVMTHDTVGVCVLAVVAAVIIFKHVINLKRIKAGTEARFKQTLLKKAKGKQDK